MANPILHGLKGLVRFSGRDVRSTFWPWAAVAGLGGMAIMFIALGWAMSGFWSEVSAFSAAHPDHTSVVSSPGNYSVHVDLNHPDAPTPDLDQMFMVMKLGVGLIVGLLAASVARRLHDTGRTAAWGLLPIVFIAISLTLLPLLMEAVMDDPDTMNLGLFGLLFLTNILYMISLVGLIILLALKSTDGPNRFGPDSKPRP